MALRLSSLVVLPSAFSRVAALLSILAVVSSNAIAQPNPLVTGKSITLPSPGVQQNVGSLPMNLVLSPDERFAISSDMGFRQSLWSIDTRTGRGV